MNMKSSKALLLCLTSLFMGGLATSQDVTSQDVTSEDVAAGATSAFVGIGPVVFESTPVVPIPLLAVRNKSFTAGEKLEFDIKYEFISAGTATEISQGQER